MKKYILLLILLFTSPTAFGGERKTFQLEEIIVQEQAQEQLQEEESDDILPAPKVSAELKLLQTGILRLESQIIDLKHQRDQLEIKNEELLVKESLAHVEYLTSYLSLLNYGESIMEEYGVVVPSTLTGIKQQVINRLNEVGYDVIQSQTEDN